MNTLLHHGLVQGLVTLIAFFSFLGICYYAYSPSRRRTFEQAAQLPISDDDAAPAATTENAK